MQTPVASRRFSKFYSLAAFVVVIGIMRAAREVVVPLALAALLAFLLHPLVNRFVHWRVNRSLAIILTVILAFGILSVVGWVVSSQVMSLVQGLPKYERNLQQKIDLLKSPRVPAALSRTARMLQRFEDEIEAPSKSPAGPDGHGQSAPVPVEVKSGRPTSFEIARQILAALLGPLETAGIVVVFVIAILFEGPDVRQRILRMAGTGRTGIASKAMDDAAHRVTRYLGMQLLVNSCYGIPIGIGLHLIGVPSALLWGLMATILRFIPFLGPWIAAAFPLALSFVIAPGWAKLAESFGLFMAMEAITSNVVEPLLYGSTTGVSGLALLFAAVFWTWLWGLPGLFLSTPLTVCLMVLGKYVPGMRFLSVLLEHDSEPHKT